MTASGKVTIAKSREGEGYGDFYPEFVASLASDGWETVQTDSFGRATVMRRQIGGATNHTTTNPAELLQQLSNLRDQGIITEQEFNAKKAEILKRM